jgi:hypothetical protein
MKRSLYRGVIALHPPVFRHTFGPEMELIFEECGGPVKLLGDALLSLLRQWVLRTVVWIVALAAVGGLLPLWLGVKLLQISQHFYLAQAKTLEMFLLATMAISLAAIVMTLMLAIYWFRYSKRRRA